MAADFDQGQHRPALELLGRSVFERGIVASPVDTRNYRRIWTRDAVIAGLAGVLVSDERVIEGLGASLESLARAIGPCNQAPSNVDPDGVAEPSYGRLAGRVDAGAWFAIGAFHYLEARPTCPRRDSLLDAVHRVLSPYDSWELNSRGLIHSPLGGDWADEYLLHGYVLMPNLLRLWALRLAASVLGDEAAGRKAQVLTELLARNYWTGPGVADGERYHGSAFERAAPVPFWRCALTPAGYDDHFDALGNALAVLLGLGTPAQRDQLFGYAAGLENETDLGLMPAFWPIVKEGDRDYSTLQGLAAHGFRNRPGEYHNGGVWPMVNGFWIAGLAAAGEDERARQLLERLVTANRRDGEAGAFCEFHHATRPGPGGTPSCTWSAAGELLAAASVAGLRFDLGERP